MKYTIQYTPEADQDVKALIKAGDKVVINKLYKLLIELQEHPKTGTGKPEQLTGELAGCYSCRITVKHRLVYQIHDHVVTVVILSVEGHYNDK
jgi:toxin YoeB